VIDRSTSKSRCFVQTEIERVFVNGDPLFESGKTLDDRPGCRDT